MARDGDLAAPRGTLSTRMARRDNLRRGSRRASAPPPPKRRKPQATGWRLWLRRAAVWGGALALVGALVLGISVAVAYRSLPTYSALKSSQVGQTIVVRAADGTEIVTLGPSYGHWIPYSEIPQVMKDAMVSIEDRRFRSHFGVDPLGIARAVYASVRDQEGPRAPSTIRSPSSAGTKSGAAAGRRSSSGRCSPPRRRWSW